MITFNKRFQHLASLKKMAQADLVSGLNKDRGTISRWWNGEIIPGTKNIRLIADYFGCDIEWLTTGNGAPFQVVSEDKDDHQIMQTVAEPPPSSIQRYEHLTWKFQHIFDFLIEAHDNDTIAINDFMSKLENDFLIRDPNYRLWMYQRREKAEKRQKKRAAEDNSDEPVDIKSTNGGKS